jgi:hypothetical protein
MEECVVWVVFHISEHSICISGPLTRVGEKMGHPPKGLPKGLLKIHTRGVPTKLEVSEKCEGCGKPMRHLIQGILEPGYEFELLPCSHCGARHRIEIQEGAFEMTLVGEQE